MSNQFLQLSKIFTLATALFLLTACGGPADSVSSVAMPQGTYALAAKDGELPNFLADVSGTDFDEERGKANLQADREVKSLGEQLHYDDILLKQGGGAAKADLVSQTVRAVADFDGDGKADVLWQSGTGEVSVSLMGGSSVFSCASLGVQTDSVMGTGDFNGDGKADIVWRNMSTGAVRISLMNGGTATQWLSVGQTPIALNTKLEGIGDFDGNGRADMLWRNQATGRSVMSYHNTDGSLASWPEVSKFINPQTTTALKVGDINGDGKADIVWRNMSSGNVVISLMDGNVPTWKSITSSPIPLSVALEAIGDFDHNGKADLLWRNTVTGRSLMSYHNADGSLASWPVVSNYINPVTTSAVGVGDVNGDGNVDILWRNLNTGNSVLSIMNGNMPTWQVFSFSTCPDFSVASITPTTAKLNTLTVFKVTGTNLPLTAQLAIDTWAHCEAPELRTTTGFRQTCFPIGPIGLQKATVMTNSIPNGGTLIDQSRTVTLSITPLSTLKLPHSGITDRQCYRAGIDYDLVDCASENAVALSGAGKQDGMNASLNSMSYSQVARNGTSYPTTSCIYDDITGLVWEGKEAGGVRAGSNTYTNYSDRMFQSMEWANDRINDSGNTYGYVNFVNNLGLCGYTDWRLPSADELNSLVDFGSLYRNLPSFWFPNTTANSQYWSDTLYAFSFRDVAWNVNLGMGSLTVSGFSNVRLVRGGQPTYVACPSWPTGERFAVNGAEVLDKRTGLTWARCSAGQSWTGSNCEGTASRFTHEGAFIHARDQSGWRLPSVRELASLADKGCQQPAIDKAVFPNTEYHYSLSYWSATPHTDDGSYPARYYAYVVGFFAGARFIEHRSALRFVRLVRTNP